MDKMMEFKELQLEKNIREKLSLSSRIVYSGFGLIVTVFELVDLKSLNEITLAIGIFFIIYGIVGLVLFKTIYKINVMHGYVEIVRAYHPDIWISLQEVEYISLRNNELQVHYSGYVKTYNLPWLMGEDYLALKEKLNEVNNEITDENSNKNES